MPTDKLTPAMLIVMRNLWCDRLALSGTDGRGWSRTLIALQNRGLIRYRPSLGDHVLTEAGAALAQAGHTGDVK